MKKTLIFLLFWSILSSCQKDDYTRLTSPSKILNSKNTKSSDLIASKLFKDSYYTIKSMRGSNGIYLDALALDNSATKPAAIAANGVGLISLCIADAMYKKTNDAVKWEANSAALVNSTLQTFINFKTKGATNTKGLFRRYFNITNGLKDGDWSEEFSTIDNAIFAIGLVFCKNYFSNDLLIVNKVNSLLNTMDFTAAISNNGQQLFMVLDQNGNGSNSTSAYNEYMLVAWLAKNVSPSNSGYSKSQIYWDTFYKNPVTASVQHPGYWGIDLISDGGFVSNFIPQFSYYYCNYFKNNSSYMNYFRNFRKSDSLFWTKKSPGINNYEWGLGAGENPGDGYSANKIDDNALQIISPHIIAGFIPIYQQSLNDLISLYKNGKGVSVYNLPNNSSKKILWRYSRTNSALRCSYIQAVDFSTMLYGLTSLPENLGNNFFATYNNLDSTIWGQ